MAEKNMNAKISVEFEETANRQQLSSGDNLPTLFGKIKKFFTDLKTVAFSGSYNDLSDKPTTATTDTDGLMSAEDKSKLDDADNTYALKSKYGDTTINVGRKANTTVGEFSTAEGHFTTASGTSSHAEGYKATASGSNSHAEGGNTTASGTSSHAEGLYATASGSASHAGGTGTKALHDNEVAYGKYNESKDDTLFSIGDGTADDARHNAFEITTSGGKLHDKDIATTDDLSAYAKKADVPNIKVNAAVNADTVGEKLPEKIFYDNGMSSDLDSATKSGCYAASPDTLNAPLSSWWVVDTMNYNGQFIVQKAHMIGSASTTVSYIRNYTNNAWSDWTEMYTSGNKPYVTGSATVAANSTTCTSNHGYTPSAVIWWDGNSSGVAVSFNDTQFAINNTSAVDRTVNYLIFK